MWMLQVFQKVHLLAGAGHIISNGFQLFEDDLPQYDDMRL